MQNAMNLTDNHKAGYMELSVMHLTHPSSKGEQFLQCIITGDKRWVMHTSPTKKASTTWKHPSISPLQNFKPMPLVRNIMVGVFWAQKGALLVDFTDYGNTVTAEHCCSTLERLQQAIHHKRPGLLH
jgi:hypothetical protein